MKKKQFSDTVNQWATNAIPFIFIIDYEMKNLQLYRLEDALKNDIFYQVNGQNNWSDEKESHKIELKIKPIGRKMYYNRFEKVQQFFKKGDASLINLTFATEIETNASLKEIFQNSSASYKLLFKDQFVVFSPECFIKIKSDQIYTYPMKGTQDAEVENAAQLILNNDKEKEEHRQVVDLMISELEKVASDIQVDQYRYIQNIKTNRGNLLQTSSELSGKLPEKWKTNLGEIILKLLPAGSINGMPKPESLKIIKEVEKGKRGFYTGIFGVFDGQNLDSGVMIRFIEQKNGKTYYRSGGGITAQSDAELEYQELIRKIYVPTV